MDSESLNHFHESISRHRDALLEWMNSNAKRKNIHSGSAEIKDVLHTISELKDVLEKIDAGNFGTCEVCKGDVEVERLEHDCTLSVCLDCYTEEELRNLERDLELAAKVQKQLLPSCKPSLENIQIAVRSEPAHIVGGDYYDFFNYKNGLQGFVIGDVMGKGLPASMLMSNLQASLRILGPVYNELNLLAARLNELFRFNTKLVRFISLFLAALDMKTKAFHYCNAGHHPPLLWQSDNKTIKWLRPTAPAIGLTINSEFASRTLHLKSGDMVVMYTDGLVEARNADKEEFGEERIAEYVKENYEKSTDEFFDGFWEYAKRFTGKFEDDTTLMIIKLT
jgi:sigma-B regulation protein RsbU (phosphoserine phosphatase)